jgi:hypothetical protein
MINKDDSTDGKDGEIHPMRNTGTLKSNVEKQGSNEDQMKKG